MRKTLVFFALSTLIEFAGVSLASANSFAVPTGAAALSEAGAVVADGQPISDYSYNPAGMAFFSGNRAAIEILAQRPSISYSGAAGSSGAATNTSILADLYYTHRFNSMPLAVGIGVTSPYLLRSDWAADSLYSGSPYLQNQVRVIDINPSIAYLVLPDLSVAVGLDYYQSIGGRFGNISADGGGVGGRIGLLYSTEVYNVGLSYISPASLSAGGGKIELPSKLQAGFRYRWTPSFATELDVDWTNWANTQLPYYGNLGWKSALAYRVGLSYHLSQDLEIRGGIAHEDSPAGAQAIQLATPATASNLASFGLGIGLGPWHYDIGASYALSGTAGGAPFAIPDSSSTVPGGSYKASAFTLGVALARSF
ncbi:OmpP1/FadL family transporter [Acidithiobacillus sp. IBUN Pt1247-S3]|uniref:OmpP1/FadL family transporter n=1 Tax=Acidithiobacillus sp. IBUN Pt1247-S3 TaxID=3166642 RepID=UPI0034E3ADAB